jgi:hypothetical protein
MRAIGSLAWVEGDQSKSRATRQRGMPGCGRRMALQLAGLMRCRQKKAARRRLFDLLEACARQAPDQKK